MFLGGMRRAGLKILKPSGFGNAFFLLPRRFEKTIRLVDGIVDK